MSQTLPNIENLLPQNLDQQALLRAAFGIHFSLISLALMRPWMPHAYMFYNGFFLAGLLWAMSAPAAESELPLLKSLFVNLLAIIMDIFCMASGYSYIGGWDSFVVMAAIFNLIIRLPSSLVLYKVRIERLRMRYDDFERNPEPYGPNTPYDVPPASSDPPSYPGHSFADSKPITP